MTRVRVILWILVILALISSFFSVKENSDQLKKVILAVAEMKENIKKELKKELKQELEKEQT